MSAFVLPIWSGHENVAGLTNFPSTPQDTLVGDAVASSEASLSLEKDVNQPPAIRRDQSKWFAPCIFTGHLEDSILGFVNSVWSLCSSRT